MAALRINILFLPSVIFIVPIRSKTVDWIHADVNHSLQLRWAFLFIRDCVWHWGIDKDLSPQVTPPTEGDESQDTPHNTLPLSVGCPHLGVSLTETCSVQALLLFHWHFLPIPLFLVAERHYFWRILLEPDGWHGEGDVVDVDVLPIDSIPYNVPVSNLGSVVDASCLLELQGHQTTLARP